MITESMLLNPSFKDWQVIEILARDFRRWRQYCVDNLGPAGFDSGWRPSVDKQGRHLIYFRDLDTATFIKLKINV